MIDTEAELEIIGDRQIDDRLFTLHVVVAGRQLGVAAELIARFARHDQDRATGSVAAEQRALRSFQHLDIFEIEQRAGAGAVARSEEHTSELQSLMRISYAVFCL